MKPGTGAAHVLADIAEGVPTETIRRKWASGKYGPDGERPKGEMVAGWLKLAGRT